MKSLGKGVGEGPTVQFPTHARLVRFKVGWGPAPAPPTALLLTPRPEGSRSILPGSGPLRSSRSPQGVGTSGRAAPTAELTARRNRPLQGKQSERVRGPEGLEASQSLALIPYPRGRKLPLLLPDSGRCFLRHVLTLLVQLRFCAHCKSRRARGQGLAALLGSVRCSLSCSCRDPDLPMFVSKAQRQRRQRCGSVGRPGAASRGETPSFSPVLQSRPERALREAGKARAALRLPRPRPGRS